MTATEPQEQPQRVKPCRIRALFNNIKFFVLCHGMLQLALLLVSGYLKGSISTIEKRYGFSSQKSGLVASFNEVGNTVLIVFVSFFGSRVHRPRCIGIGALIASMAAFLIALPHFISGEYEYTDDISRPNENVTGLCLTESERPSSNQTCSKKEGNGHNDVFYILLLGQLLLGIGCVPVQPFGISYIDDYANKKNSPFYVGILFALTVIGPALGYLMGSFLLRFYVDFNTVYPVEMSREDPRWVGAWWLGFLLAGTLLFLTSLPYLFFPRSMKTEEKSNTQMEPTSEKLMQEEKKAAQSDPMNELSLTQFLKNFPHIMWRTLRNPIFLLVVLAQVNLAAMVAGLATFMPKFIERQFSKTASFSNIMIGGFSIPSAMCGIMAGGMILRRLNLSIRASAAMCTAAVLVAIIFAMPLLFFGCQTQRIAGVFPANNENLPQCSPACSCSNQAYNPVCSSDLIEYRSPCHAGCKVAIKGTGLKILNYTDCCLTPSGYAVPGTCGSGCSHLIVPFMIFSSLTCFLASLSQTPSFMMILRSVTPEDKSLALGIQFMLFRVLAFLPAPVLYGSAIDSTCILWGEKCDKNTSCLYYDLDLFRTRFLGLQTFFIFGGLMFFVLSYVVLRRSSSAQPEQTEQINCSEKPEKEQLSQSNGQYEKV
ncbi:solute carrier organic anion transporter family member 2B1 [Astyanax mexicanus]|uniref:solute carrier organic anion transporter family member 2B1 n=1 Tax=Astyanax mexicanus TaxID=7994 RepID=UPI0020CB04CA|nr:solute carrier organic anion transporter family member 2B1 [Astyanax mexicanus]XP_007259650.2 solute carrier organic anion transporter family member 2B1 [Astyanax mexicanus]XP_049322364.1 solute carrier organic anion transporter family member 2B1 [Astyanax mexicanus]